MGHRTNAIFRMHAQKKKKKKKKIREGIFLILRVGTNLRIFAKALITRRALEITFIKGQEIKYATIYPRKIFGCVFLCGN